MKQERRAALHQIIEGLGGLIELRDIYDEAIALEAEIRSLTGTRDALHAAAEQARTQAAAERARAELSRREADGVVAENQRRMRESAEEFAAQEDQQDAARAQHAARETAGHAETVRRRVQELATLDAEIAEKTALRDAVAADLAATRARLG